MRILVRQANFLLKKNPLSLSSSPDRDSTILELGDVEVEVSVWESTSGWNANSVIDGRDYRVMGAADREDALERLEKSIMAKTESEGKLTRQLNRLAHCNHRISEYLGRNRVRSSSAALQLLAAVIVR